MIEYKEINSSFIKEIKKIYESNNWIAYLNDENKLKRALDNSCFMYGAFDNNKLVGFIRCVGDEEHILVIQDLIIDAEYQRKGIGTKLFKFVIDKYKNVRMINVITDIDDNVANSFYRSFNLKELSKGNMISYFK